MTSTTAVPIDTGVRPAPISPIPFVTLLRVEFRKMLDTRSGKAVLATIIGIALVILGWLTIRGDTPPNFTLFANATMQGVALLTPVIAILAMASEWTQRTALTTFTLAPRRGRVLAAKFVSAILLLAAVNLVVLVLVAGTTELNGLVQGDPTSYSGFGDVVRSTLIIGTLTATMAAAFGALAAQTAVALVAYFIAPTAFSLFSLAVLGNAAPWFDVFSAFDRLSGSDPWTNVGQTLTAVTIWVVIPAVVGVARSLRREVK